MADYKTFLAAAILTEDRVVTYRLLSRELRCHVNTAKRMLFDFHQVQNGKKPGTVHATYLVGGLKREAHVHTVNGHHAKDGEDDVMQSSPFASSMPQPEEHADDDPVFSITLVREEQLAAVRSEYDKISTIHIYSLAPHPLKDLRVLADTTRELYEKPSTEDPQEACKIYGTIANKYVRRRAGRPPPGAAKPTAKSTATVPTIKPAPSSTPKAAPTAKVENEDKKPSSQPSSAKDFFGKRETSAKPPASKASPKDPGSIFKAFAKAKQSSNLSEGSPAASPKPETPKTEDEEMKDASDGEDDYVPPVAAPKTNVDADRKARLEREARLRAMMEEESDEESPSANQSTEASQAPSEPPATQQEAEVEAETEAPPPTAPTKRRGRRRVMKKTTTKDEEGFLVTKEEPVWESFSEDEAPVAKPKAFSSSAGVNKTKKPPAKSTQGRNIMSFFGKK